MDEHLLYQQTSCLPAVRGAPVTVRRYAIGSTQVKITFRKRTASSGDVLAVLQRVREMVERE